MDNFKKAAAEASSFFNRAKQVLYSYLQFYSFFFTGWWWWKIKTLRLSQKQSSPRRNWAAPSEHCSSPSWRRWLNEPIQPNRSPNESSQTPTLFFNRIQVNKYFSHWLIWIWIHFKKKDLDLIFGSNFINWFKDLN